MSEVTPINLVGGKINLVLMTGSFCAPCRFVKPIFNDFIENHKDENVEAQILDVLEIDPDFVRKNGVMNVPTLLVFHGQNFIARESEQEKLTDVNFYKQFK